VLRMLALEYATVSLVGIALGAILGRVVGQQMLSFLEVTETGAKVEPGFILQTEWLPLGLAVAIVAAVFTVVLALATRAVADSPSSVRLRRGRVAPEAPARARHPLAVAPEGRGDDHEGVHREVPHLVRQSHHRQPVAWPDRGERDRAQDLDAAARGDAEVARR